MRVAGQPFAGQQVGVGLVMAAPHPAAQLVQLGQAKFVGTMNQDGVGVGDVDAGFDNGRAQQHIEAALVKVAHHLLQLALAQLAVGHADARFRQQFGQPFAHVFDGFHFVVQIKHLAATLQFAQHGFAHHAGAVRADKGFHRQPAAGGGGNHREVAQAFQAHGQRARNRRGGQRQHVHIGAQALELFFLAHAKAVFLVDDHQAQAGKFHIGLGQPVGADHNVHAAVGQAGHGGLELFAALEARQLGDFHRPVGKAVGKILKVLFGQQGGRRQHRHLFAAQHRHKRRAQGHFGFAKAHIAAHQPVHRLARGHVGNHRVDGGLLVGGFVKGKAIGKGGVVVFGQGKGVAFAGGALGVQVQQLGGGVAGFFGGALFGLVPLRRAQFGQRGVFLRAAGPA